MQSADGVKRAQARHQAHAKRRCHVRLCHACHAKRKVGCLQVPRLPRESAMCVMLLYVRDGSDQVVMVCDHALLYVKDGSDKVVMVCDNVKDGM